MGCLARIGCLVLIVACAAALWLTRGRWMPLLPHRLRGTNAAATSVWQRLTVDGAARGEAALRQLASPGGPDSVRVAPGDLAAYIFQELARSLPNSADSIEVAAIGDQLYVRAVVRTADLGGGLGPLSALVGERERIQLGGTLRILRPGLAELRVREIKLRELVLPEALIPRIVQQMARGDRPAGLAPDGVALRTPPYVGDIHISDGRITIFRAYSVAGAGSRRDLAA